MELHRGRLIDHIQLVVKDIAAPGERKYHPGYYGAFVLDPDGNNIEVVFHGPAKKSAGSAKVSF